RPGPEPVRTRKAGPGDRGRGRLVCAEPAEAASQAETGARLDALPPPSNDCRARSIAFTPWPRARRGPVHMARSVAGGGRAVLPVPEQGPIRPPAATDSDAGPGAENSSGAVAP